MVKLSFKGDLGDRKSFYFSMGIVVKLFCKGYGYRGLLRLFYIFCNIEIIGIFILC